MGKRSFDIALLSIIFLVISIILYFTVFAGTMGIDVLFLAIGISVAGLILSAIVRKIEHVEERW